MTAYITSRGDHHSYLRSKPIVNFSGPILQKLFKNIETIYVRWSISSQPHYPWIENCIQTPIQMWNSSWTHQTRWSNIHIIFSKGEWLINSTETFNFLLIIHILSNCLPMNSETTSFDQIMKKQIKLKKENKLFSLHFLKNLSNVFFISRK